MDSDAKFHISYLESRLSKLKKNVTLNQEQILAYEKILTIAKASSDYADYLSRLGEDADLFSLARSEQLDRYRSMSALYKKFGLSENEEIYQKRLKIAKDSKSYMDIATNLPQTVGLTSERNAIEKLNLAVSILQLLFQTMTLAEKSHRVSKAKQTKEEYIKLKSLDPHFSFDSYFTNPYLFINPFTKIQLNSLKESVESLLGGHF